jgi:hypothetical protein
VVGSRIFWCLVAIFLIGGGSAATTWVARDSRRKQAEIRRILAEGTQTEGVVTRRWESGGRGPRYHVAYRYSANGQEYEFASVDIEWKRWKNLDVGSPIAVVYMPSDPTNTFPRDDPPYVPPVWFPMLLLPLSLGTGIAVFIAGVLRKQRLEKMLEA